MNRPTKVVCSCELEHSDFAGVQVDFDFGNVSPPGVHGVSIAGVSVVVPFDARRMRVADECPQGATLGCVFASDLIVSFKLATIRYEAALDQVDFRGTVPFGDKA